MKEQQEELNSAAEELDQVNAQRKAALVELKDQIENYNKLDSASSAGRLVLSKNLNQILSGLEAHDKIIDMITHDIVGLVQNFEQFSTHLFQTSAFTQTILETLKSKGLVTAEELKNTWSRLVKENKEKSEPTTLE